MELAALIKEEAIVLHLQAQSKQEAIDQMIERLNHLGYLSDVDAYQKAVLDRENQGSTGIGFGVAIPHGKSKGVKTSGLAFARLAKPIDWQSLDGNPVSMFFLIAIPEENAGNEHLQILAAISRKMIHEAFRTKLMAAKTPKDLLQILKEPEQEII